MRISHFNQAELAFRWRISPRTLERWRWSKSGPIFLKIGGLSMAERFQASVAE